MAAVVVVRYGLSDPDDPDDLRSSGPNPVCVGAIEKHPSLKRLWLGQADASNVGEDQSNIGGSPSAQARAKALQVNSRLEHVVLEGIPIGDIGMKMIADGIRRNTRLNLLSIQGHKATNDGARAIARALKENWTMIRCSLFRTYEDDGIDTQLKEEIEEIERRNYALKCNAKRETC